MCLKILSLSIKTTRNILFCTWDDSSNFWKFRSQNGLKVDKNPFTQLQRHYRATETSRVLVGNSLWSKMEYSITVPMWLQNPVISLCNEHLLPLGKLTSRQRQRMWNYLILMSIYGIELLAFNTGWCRTFNFIFNSCLFKVCHSKIDPYQFC